MGTTSGELCDALHSRVCNVWYRVCTGLAEDNYREKGFNLSKKSYRGTSGLRLGSIGLPLYLNLNVTLV